MSCMPDARADGVVFGLRSGGSPSVNRQVQSAGAGLLSPALDLSVLSSLPAEAALGPPGGQRLRQLHLGSLIVYDVLDQLPWHCRAPLDQDAAGDRVPVPLDYQMGPPPPVRY